MYNYFIFIFEGLQGMGIATPSTSIVKSSTLGLDEDYDDI